MKYIELFAGCGGLSLGLKSAGFKLQFANELSPMASETYAFNILGIDLTQPNSTPTQSVKWITSNFSTEQIGKRLRESPLSFPNFDQGYSDVHNFESFNKTLIIGDIRQLNSFLSKNTETKNQLKNSDIDLVSGGPPCQSFSMAGLRQHDNERNLLPMEFAQFVNLMRPKIALLENVSGILRAFNINGVKHYAWFEVARAFAAINYTPLCLHVNAKYAGAAQNRPRFILLALRSDVFKKLLSIDLPRNVYEAFLKSHAFVKAELSNQNVRPTIDLLYYDVDKDREFFTNAIFSPLLRYSDSNLFSAFDAIDDLKENATSRKKNKYRLLLDTTFSQLNPHKPLGKVIFNHELRTNSTKVRQRFLLYQYISTLITNTDTSKKLGIEKNISEFLQNPAQNDLTPESIRFLLRKKWLSDDGFSLTHFSDKRTLCNYLETLKTKKQTQRALIADKPAPAALSIPDDACHYDIGLQRTLTVRELARFQSFPDWFQFRSKVTTGGQMRRHEVPQYTQVGNAVPPLLGHALGIVVRTILTSAR